MMWQERGDGCARVVAVPCTWRGVSGAASTRKMPGAEMLPLITPSLCLLPTATRLWESEK